MPVPEEQEIDESEVLPPEEADDIAYVPAANADSLASIARYISPAVMDRYDVYSYRHAAAILANAFPQQLAEIEHALLNFSITQRDIGMPGGNESIIPKKFSYLLRPAGWVEARVQGDLLVRMQEYDELPLPNGTLRKIKRPLMQVRTIPNFIDGHKIDYVKNEVAFDVEWNSKDQTFDRDLYALRAFHECGLINVGVLVTRSASLNPVFPHIPQLNRDGSPALHTSGPYRGSPKSVRAKFGASTTWMGKLLYRLNAGRHGGCPVLVFGIRPKLITDWNHL
jgi:hypothetical protein